VELHSNEDKEMTLSSLNHIPCNYIFVAIPLEHLAQITRMEIEKQKNRVIKQKGFTERGETTTNIGHLMISFPTRSTR